MGGGDNHVIFILARRRRASATSLPARLPATPSARALSAGGGSGSFGREVDDLLQPGDEARARPVRQRGQVPHRLAVAPEQLVQVAAARRVAQVRVREGVRLLGDPPRAVVVQPGEGEGEGEGLESSANLLRARARG